MKSSLVPARLQAPSSNPNSNVIQNDGTADLIIIDLVKKSAGDQIPGTRLSNNDTRSNLLMTRQLLEKLGRGMNPAVKIFECKLLVGRMDGIAVETKAH